MLSKTNNNINNDNNETVIDISFIGFTHFSRCFCHNLCVSLLGFLAYFVFVFINTQGIFFPSGRQ